MRKTKDYSNVSETAYTHKYQISVHCQEYFEILKGYTSHWSIIVNSETQTLYLLVMYCLQSRQSSDTNQKEVIYSAFELI